MFFSQFSQSIKDESTHLSKTQETVFYPYTSRRKYNIQHTLLFIPGGLGFLCKYICLPVPLGNAFRLHNAQICTFLNENPVHVNATNRKPKRLESKWFALKWKQNRRCRPWKVADALKVTRFKFFLSKFFFFFFNKCLFYPDGRRKMFLA